MNIVKPVKNLITELENLVAKNINNVKKIRLVPVWKRTPVSLIDAQPAGNLTIFAALLTILLEFAVIAVTDISTPKIIFPMVMLQTVLHALPVAIRRNIK